jgi:succinoglycan biosynthesis protein ExoV
MKLHYWPKAPNFGDQLNPWLWGKLLPGAFDNSDDTMFVGIGTLLNSELDKFKDKTKVVFGSGVGYGSSLPHVDKTWKFYFVRGPLSAKALEIDPKFALTDAAILAKLVLTTTSEKKYKFGFCPHWETRSNALEHLCTELGILYVDPFNSVDAVIEKIGSVETLITEAMHGAIFADFLRVPWVPVYSGSNILHFKWQDWCQSVHLEYQPQHIPLPYDRPLHQLEFVLKLHSRIKRKLSKRALQKLSANAKPSLSSDRVFEELLERAQEKLEAFKADFLPKREPALL